MMRDRGMGHAQFVAGAGDAAQPRGGFEGAKGIGRRQLHMSKNLTYVEIIVSFQMVLR